MNGNNFTNKAQDALMQAQTIAQEKGQSQIDALHLLFALLLQEGSIITTILQKLGVDGELLKKKVEAQIIKIPIISTPQAFGQFYLTQDMAKVLDRARQEAINAEIVRQARPGEDGDDLEPPEGGGGESAAKEAVRRRMTVYLSAWMLSPEVDEGRVEAQLAALAEDMRGL